jgi:hypothetical protein
MSETPFPFGKALLLAAVLAAFPLGRSVPLAADAYDSVFEELEQPAAMTSAAYQKDIIRENFLADPEASVSFVLKRLWNPPAGGSYEQKQAAQMDLIAVRAVLAEMPVAIQEQAVLTEAGSARNQARLLEVIGGLGTPRALDKLEQALSDQRAAGLEGDALDGWPLRICDVAYNTITHRLQPDGFRTPLAAAHSTAQRDRWIGQLRQWLLTHRDEATAVFSTSG